MDLIQAIVLGILQGLTEFLPISSSAHLRIAPALLGWPDPGAAFTANIQLGTLLAVIIYFWKDLSRFGVGFFNGLVSSGSRQTQEYKFGWAIVWGTLPICVFGVLLKDQIDTVFRSLNLVAAMLIVMGLILFASEKVGKQHRNLESCTWKDGLLIGLWQAAALIPGCSRSGSTITGALFLGFERAVAARISFLMSLPSIFLAALLSTYEHRTVMGEQVTQLLVANVTSFLVGYACIAFLMKFLQKNPTHIFVYYRIALGVGILGMVASGYLSPNAGLP